MTPEDRRYTKTHEWIKIDGDVATVGITDHAQDSLGDITFVELPVKGSSHEKEHECAVIESVKAASDIFTPIAGEVAEINEQLETAPETINQDPYGEGWLFKLKDFDADDVAELMDAEDYEARLGDED